MSATQEELLAELNQVVATRREALRVEREALQKEKDRLQRQIALVNEKLDNIRALLALDVEVRVKTP